MRIVVGISGASGIRYGVRLIESLSCESLLIMSSEAMRMCKEETGMSVDEVFSKAEKGWRNDDLFSPLASGSTRFDAMVICPCSTSTMSKVACGIADNLLTRTAAVALKERRRLVVVLRETPLSTIHLRNMLTLSEAGATVMPACPAFYPKPDTVDDMVDFVAGRVLDQLDLDHDLYRRWSDSDGDHR